MERRMVLAMDQGAKEGVMDHGAIAGATDGANNGSRSNRPSDGRCERWIREQIG
jgi:hypothetical protein